MRAFKVCSINDRSCWLDLEACSAARAAEAYARTCFLSKHTTVKASLVIAVASDPRLSRLFIAAPVKTGNGFGSWVILGELDPNLTLAADLPFGFQFLSPTRCDDPYDALEGPTTSHESEVFPEA